MKKVLVTGGAGFIGGHLVQRIVQMGWQALVVDNLYSGVLNNISPMFSTGLVKFYEQDICEPLELEVDWIFHLACPASPPYYQKDPIKTFLTSVLGTLRVLELTEKTNARLLFASTSEVYGNPLEHPQKESYFGNVNPNGIRACYDEGKRGAECLVMDFIREKNVDARIARIFNTYGPNMQQNDGRVVSNFICQALQGKDLTLYGDGSQTRSFCFITDLVDGLWKLMQVDKGLAKGPINLGNPHEYSMIELAQQVLRLSHSSSKIIQQSLPLDDPLSRKPAIELAKTVLGWEPKIMLEEGLLNTIHYFKKVLK